MAQPEERRMLVVQLCLTLDSLAIVINMTYLVSKRENATDDKNVFTRKVQQGPPFTFLLESSGEC